MDSDGRAPGSDPDGVRVRARAGGGAVRLIGLLALVVVAGVVGWRMLAARDAAAGDVDASAQDERTLPPPDQAATHAPDGTSGVPATAARTAAAGAMPATPRNGEDPTPDLSDYVLPGEAPTMNQVIDALHQRGIRTGLGAFNPPGTKPPLLGLEVPDGFELPEGYVRHHQATDDGQRIAPILMFHPDLGFIELRGRRVAIPANRVVPPELAPPGMPLRPVRIPPPRDGGGP